MSIHQERTHPVPVAGCGPCRWATVQLAPSATGSTDAAKYNKREAEKKADMEAYPRLLKSGVQPAHVGGSARMEKQAESRFEIESGNLLRDKTVAKKVDKVLADMPAVK